MKTKERVFLGILGALLGSILGSVSIVLENQVSNTFSLIGGVVMAAFTLQGYIQLAGRLSKKGVAISLVLMAVMCALANQVNCTIEIMETVEAVQGMDFLEVFGGFGELMECGSMAAAKEKGLVRSEGKEYVMGDGDIVLFRFNV